MAAAVQPQVIERAFGSTADGKKISIFELSNGRGATATITNYGGRVVSLFVPDRSGKFDDVVLGFDTLAGYEDHDAYFGALIGRYANRIAKGRFSLGGKQYELPVNDGENHLHGGPNGFHRVVWSAAASSDANGSHLTLTYLSPDGEEGYPGDLDVEVVYSLTENNELKIVYSARTNQSTIINLTNHSYFNLAGAGSVTVLGHELMIDADRFTPTDSTSIPTGELRSVKGTPFDLTSPSAIGARIGDENEQLKFGHGYDHNWVLNRAAGDGVSLVATVYEPKSGRLMEVLTTEPGLQFYSGNFLDGTIIGKNGKNYPYRSALCLEAQHFPDSPNHPEFPSTEIDPGEEYAQTTIYRFSVR